MFADSCFVFIRQFGLVQNVNLGSHQLVAEAFVNGKQVRAALRPRPVGGKQEVTNDEANESEQGFAVVVHYVPEFVGKPPGQHIFREFTQAHVARYFDVVAHLHPVVPAIAMQHPPVQNWLGPHCVTGQLALFQPNVIACQFRKARERLQKAVPDVGGSDVSE